jgi:antitoxin ParD1/3/4
MKNTSVTLGEHLESFIADQIQRGRYGSASEVVRAGLRILEEQEVKIATLQQALIQGEHSGPSEKFDMNQFIQFLHTQSQQSSS